VWWWARLRVGGRGGRGRGQRCHHECGQQRRRECQRTSCVPRTHTCGPLVSYRSKWLPLVRLTRRKGTWCGKKCVCVCGGGGLSLGVQGMRAVQCSRQPPHPLNAHTRTLPHTRAHLQRAAGVLHGRVALLAAGEAVSKGGRLPELQVLGLCGVQEGCGRMQRRVVLWCAASQGARGGSDGARRCLSATAAP
jgi:hypothetical protein